MVADSGQGTTVFNFDLIPTHAKYYTRIFFINTDLIKANFLHKMPIQQTLGLGAACGAISGSVSH